MIRQTLVIPAHNEARLLPRLLNTIDVARARIVGGATGVRLERWSAGLRPPRGFRGPWRIR